MRFGWRSCNSEEFVRKQTCHDTVSERLRRWTRNPLGSARRGSNPLGVAYRTLQAVHEKQPSTKTLCVKIGAGTLRNGITIVLHAEGHVFS